MKVLKVLKELKKRNVLGVIRAALVLVAAVWFTQAANASGTVADAARMDDLSQARQLVASGADVNQPEPDGTTPLLWAVYNASPALVELLLDAGADPNIANNLNISPLLQASRYGSAEMIALLLSHGATLQAATRATESPLMAAARRSNAQAPALM